MCHVRDQLHRVRRQGAEPNAALRAGGMVRDELPSVPPGGPRLTMLSLTDLFGISAVPRQVGPNKGVPFCVILPPESETTYIRSYISFIERLRCLTAARASGDGSR